MPTTRLSFASVSILTALLLLLCSISASAGAKFTVRHRFSAARNGSAPFAGLVLDRGGDLYGTTWGGGGTGAFGVAFELLPLPDGRWAERVLHRFDPKAEGGGPLAELAFDATGNL